MRLLTIRRRRRLSTVAFNYGVWRDRRCDGGGGYGRIGESRRDCHALRLIICRHRYGAGQ